jgi:hypothetical protein
MILFRFCQLIRVYVLIATFRLLDITFLANLLDHLHTCTITGFVPPPLPLLALPYSSLPFPFPFPLSSFVPRS